MICPNCKSKLNFISIIKSWFKPYCNFTCTNCSTKLCINKTQFSVYSIIIASISVFLFFDLTSNITNILESILKVFLSFVIMFICLLPTIKVSYYNNNDCKK